MTYPDGPGPYPQPGRAPGAPPPVQPSKAPRGNTWARLGVAATILAAAIVSVLGGAAFGTHLWVSKPRSLRGARRLALFHHDPSHGDDRVDRILRDASELAVGTCVEEVVAASEGLTMVLSPAASEAVAG